MLKINKLFTTLCLATAVTLVTVGCGKTDSSDTTTTTAAVADSDSKADNKSDAGENDDKENEASQHNVAVLSGSLAHAWELAGGELAATTEDYWDADDSNSDSPLSVGSLTAPNLEMIVDAEIDYVILSANISDHVALEDSFKNLGITTAYFGVETFEDYKEMMGTFTEMTGRDDLYKSYVTDVQAEIDVQRARITGDAPNILFLRCYSTGVKAKGSDSMTGEMLKDMGCINIADTDNAVVDNLSMEAIIMADPDYIFVTTMGDEEAALVTLENTFLNNPSWASLKAVQNNNYHLLEKALFQNKPNERWAESYTILADILYGE